MQHTLKARNAVPYDAAGVPPGMWAYMMLLHQGLLDDSEHGAVPSTWSMAWSDAQHACWL